MKNFPEIENLRRVQEALFEGLTQVQVTLKLDGTNVALGMFSPAGQPEIVARGRNKWYLNSAEQADIAFDGYGFCNTVVQHLDMQRLHTVHAALGDFLVFGEWFGQGIQRRAHYGEGKQFMAFDLWTAAAGWLLPEEVVTWTQALGLAHVPILFSGHIADLPAFLTQMEALACQDLSTLHPGWSGANEGLVIRPLLAEEQLNRFGHRRIAKLKNPAFEERVHEKVERPAAELQRLAEIEALARVYFGPNRVEPQMAKLHAAGVDTRDIRNLKEVIRFVVEDGRKDILRDIGAGLIPFTVQEMLRPAGKLIREAAMEAGMA